MFSKSYRQLAGAIVTLMYEMQSPCNFFTLSLSGSHSHRSNSWRDDKHYYGDQGVKPVTMEIMMVLWRWRSKAQDDDGHIMPHILIARDVYILCILFGLVQR